jgi:hypothetical protein
MTEIPNHLLGYLSVALNIGKALHEGYAPGYSHSHILMISCIRVIPVLSKTTPTHLLRVAESTPMRRFAAHKLEQVMYQLRIQFP